MVRSKSSIKDLKQTKKRTEQNRSYRSRMRTFLKKARVSCDTHADDATERVKGAMTELDKMVTKKIIKKNNANRRKSRLMRRLNKVLNVGQGTARDKKKKVVEKPVEVVKEEVVEAVTETAEAVVIEEIKDEPEVVEVSEEATEEKEEEEKQSEE